MESDSRIAGSFGEPGRRDFTALTDLVRDVIVAWFWGYRRRASEGATSSP